MTPSEHTPPAFDPSTSATDRGAAQAGWTLSPADAQLLEALLERGLDCSQIPAEQHERARRIVDVLKLLDCRASSADDDGLLVDATCALVDRARRSVELELSPRDEDALEALVSAGMDPRKVASSLRDRSQRHAEVLSALNVPVSDAQRSALIASTLAFVQTRETDQAERMRIGGQAPQQERSDSGGFRVRWADLISVAALLTFSAAVLTPMLGALRGYQQRGSCSANMASAGVGFGLYANDFRDLLPMASSSPAGHPWWNVGAGDPQTSNSANLYTMLRTQYAKPEALACAGNPTACRETPTSGALDWQSLDQVSYSYQNLFALPAARPRWKQASVTVVLADRSPVVPLAMRGLSINPLANSLNHRGTGQTVLLNDGSARWLRTPVLDNGDNIWLPSAIEDLIARLSEPTRAQPLRGTETPVGAEDVFLGP